VRSVVTGGGGGQPVPVGVPVGEVGYHLDALVGGFEGIDDLLRLLVPGIRPPPGEPDGHRVTVAAVTAVATAGADGEYGEDRRARGGGTLDHPGPGGGGVPSSARPSTV